MASSGKPQISFTFPYRWLIDEEDRKFLGKNLINLAKKSGLNVPMHEKLLPAFINQFAILLKYHAYQPVPVPLTQKELEKYFRELIPGAKLVSYQKFFIQKPTDEGLPVMELEMYY
jgi:hypothetical protein